MVEQCHYFQLRQSAVLLVSRDPEYLLDFLDDGIVPTRRNLTAENTARGLDVHGEFLPHLRNLPVEYDGVPTDLSLPVEVGVDHPLVGLEDVEPIGVVRPRQGAGFGE